MPSPSLLAGALALSMVQSSAAPPKGEESVAPPGGYWRLGDRVPTEPPEGKEMLTLGTVLLSLGVLRSGASALQLWIAASPQRCVAWGFGDEDDASCQGLRLYGYSGLAFGALMAGTGLVFTIVGAKRHRDHREWERRWGGTAFFPKRGAGLALHLRW